MTESLWTLQTKDMKTLLALRNRSIVALSCVAGCTTASCTAVQELGQEIDGSTPSMGTIGSDASNDTPTSPIVAVGATTGSSSSTAYDASASPGGNQVGGSDASTGPASDSATTEALDASFPDDVPVIAQCMPNLPLEPDDGGPYPNPLWPSPRACATSPAGPFSPPSSANGANVVGVDGQTITIADGYATLSESNVSGPLYTSSYSSGISFTFTDFTNALGYAIEGATKGGSRVVALGGPELTEATGYPLFTAGSYVFGDSGSTGGTLYGFGSSSSGYCQWQDEALASDGPYTLTITAISTDWIQGTLAAQDDDERGLVVNFDIPLISPCGDLFAGVLQIAELPVGCCFP